MFTINIEYTGRGEAILQKQEDGGTDKSITAHFLDRYRHSHAWNNFPRSLTARQYHNPYKAIKKFCKYKAQPEWKQFLRELLEHALGNTFIASDNYNMHDLLKSRLHLLQMVEAAHLIAVRTHKMEASVTGDSEDGSAN